MVNGPKKRYSEAKEASDRGDASEQGTGANQSRGENVTVREQDVKMSRFFRRFALQPVIRLRFWPYINGRARTESIG